MAKRPSLLSLLRRSGSAPAAIVPPSDGPLQRIRQRTPQPRRMPAGIAFDLERQARSFQESAAVVRRLTGVSSWVYQLQYATVAGIAGCGADLAVIDSQTDGLTRFWRADETAQMKRMAGSGNRKLVAYMSIGEAEEDRFYWKASWVRKSGDRAALTAKAPAWMEAQNDGGWADNYKVKYWMPAWQEIILGEHGFLDRIIDAGFDGVYLDIVDAYDYFLDKGRKSAPDEMITFVSKIARAGRRRNPDFVVIPQNGEALLADAQYRSFVSAIGKESIFYSQPEGTDFHARAFVEPNPPPLVDKVRGFLSQGLADGIPVLAVEYLMDDADNRTLTAEVAQRVRQAGYCPFFADRLLKSLHPAVLPAPQPAMT
jgi:cysteinyl-tRNA synthetase, unknown class